MADFKILTEVVPDLGALNDQQLGRLWRDWSNRPHQTDIREWLMRPLTLEERATIQERFACDVLDLGGPKGMKLRHCLRELDTIAAGSEKRRRCVLWEGHLGSRCTWNIPLGMVLLGKSFHIPEKGPVRGA